MIQSATLLVKRLSFANPGKRWAILGKGPSSDLHNRLVPDRYLTMTLNHACTLLEPAVAHFTDLEAFDACSDVLAGISGCAVVLPWHPHAGMKPSAQTLRDFATPGNPLHRSALSWLAAHDRLYSYNSTVAHRLTPNPKLPFIRVRYFSAVAAFNLLAQSAVREVCTLGVDGGTQYGKAFDQKDRLANGRESFDVQFEEIRRTCKDMGVTHVDLALEGAL